jgi:hypothetical protein
MGCSRQRVYYAGKPLCSNAGYMWDLPCGVLKFSVNSSIDMLPSFTNLRRWGKHALVNCQLCGNMVMQMLFHVLVHCKHALDQGR